MKSKKRGAGLVEKYHFINIIFNFYSFFVYKLFTEIPDYKQELKNGYYIEYTSKKGTLLKNENIELSYLENFPKKRILKMIEKDEYILLWDIDNEFYIIDSKTDKIDGPFTQKEFIDKIKAENYYKLLTWVHPFE